MSKTYSVSYRCSNCYKTYRVTFAYGVAALYGFKCFNCGLEKANKVENVPLSSNPEYLIYSGGVLKDLGLNE